jgi:hypothetical protein
MPIAKKGAKRVVAKKAAAKKGGAKKVPPKKPAKKVVKAAKPAKAPARKAAPAKAVPAKVHVAAKPAAHASNGCAERCRVCGDACSRPGLHEQHRCSTHIGMIA